ncbi:hypothetical protein POX_f07535 [Penicillium oxalicum]|uniref:hypothetical protein n=1 Tax=Penicillium oxalicum TaxID=69781 RepID=UPI0020B77C85|nr:hypothetical protein POX_f07535 [Penicillium oxalicum]KAI2787172.1 hypothetical protein POX_f07535 [Penicillium oxalicum]
MLLKLSVIIASYLTIVVLLLAIRIDDAAHSPFLNFLWISALISSVCLSFPFFAWTLEQFLLEASPESGIDLESQSRRDANLRFINWSVVSRSRRSSSFVSFPPIDRALFEVSLYEPASFMVAKVYDDHPVPTVDLGASMSSGSTLAGARTES